MMKVLFNADDYGLTKGVTDGIIKAHEEGVVHATTLMMNGNAVAYAVEQAKQHPNLRVGIHLVLTWGKPLRNDVPNLIDETGMFKYSSSFAKMEAPDVQQVEQEWRTQIEAFLATGLTLHHIDSHHHVHGWDPLKEVVYKLAKDFQVPVRYVDSLKESPEILLTDTLYVGFYGEGVERDIFEKLQELSVESVEVMTHPAFVDADLQSVSSYTSKREAELDILCSLEIPDWVEEM
ncbi:chitin disaccharide deacetylase [Virgibacillus soli]|uniref:Chitin disaccharide deacetylase n=1 Tax=Paracerasibacillus soli TaxID=480284 RepID=A0ABU5CWI5_9BACI|nr:chitin disaccharide deacetylase [Virgibacillus soli]MDY0410231.1 chitin disaccharide deacetylase [Virgibacillus soli]